MRINIGLGTLLFIVFLVLKLTENIDWSWFWVTSPLWITAGIWVLFLGVFALFTLVAFLLSK